jgi:hypothetical protein
MNFGYHSHYLFMIKAYQKLEIIALFKIRNPVRHGIS